MILLKKGNVYKSQISLKITQWGKSSGKILKMENTSKNILIVDDNESNLEIAKQACNTLKEEINFNPTFLNSFDEALSSFDKYDKIVSDLFESSDGGIE